MKEAHFAAIAADAKRLPAIERHGPDPEATRLSRADRLSDLPGQRVVDDLALAHDQHPVVGAGIDGSVQLGTMLRQLIAGRNVENKLLEATEIRRQRSQVVAVH